MLRGFRRWGAHRKLLPALDSHRTTLCSGHFNLNQPSRTTDVESGYAVLGHPVFNREHRSLDADRPHRRFEGEAGLTCQLLHIPHHLAPLDLNLRDAGAFLLRRGGFRVWDKGFALHLLQNLEVNHRFLVEDELGAVGQEDRRARLLPR